MELVTNPEQELANAPDVTLQPLPADYKNLARSAIGQGLLLGGGDEAEAWLVSKITGRPQDEVYQEIKDERGAYHQKNPVTSSLAEVGGAFIPMAVGAIAEPFTGGASTPLTVAGATRTAGALGRLGKHALLGGGYGTIAGGLSADPGDRFRGAVQGGITGGLLGASIAPAFQGASRAWNWLKEKTASGTDAKDAAAGVLARTGVAPADLLARKARDEAQGIPSVLAQTNPELMAIAEKAANKNKEASKTLRDEMASINEGAIERVKAQNTQKIGKGNYYDDLDAINKDLKEKTRPLYEEAHSFGTVNDPKINVLLKEPEFAAYFDKAKQIARAEELAAITKGEDPSKYKLQDIYTFTNAPDGTITGVRTSQLPDARTLDYMKRAMDDTITSAYSSDKSTIKSTIPALKDTREGFLKLVDEAVPAYKEARKFYSGKMDLADAMDKGKNEFKNLDHEEVVKYIKGLNDGEKEAFKAGALRDMYDRIIGPKQVNPGYELIQSPKDQKKLEALFDGNKNNFDLYKAALQRESQMYGETSKFLKSTGHPGYKDNEVINQIISDTITGGAKNGLANQALRWINSSHMNDETAKQVAKMLSSKEPAEVAAAVKAIEDYSTRAAQRSETVGNRADVTVRGINAALPPAPESAKDRDLNPDELIAKYKPQMTQEDDDYVNEQLKKYSPKR